MTGRKVLAQSEVGDWECPHCSRIMDYTSWFYHDCDFCDEGDYQAPQTEREYWEEVFSADE